jgi:thioredoxin reductase (NADPH)
MAVTNEPNVIRVFGAHWCPDCRRSKKFLSDQRIPFEWFDVDDDPGYVETVEAMNGGKHIIPTIVFADGSHLSEPTNEELAEKLGLTREAMHDVYDLIVVGGGPAGLTAAIYAARENIRTLVLDRSALGGQAGVTERVDNYPGFPEGVGGAELAERFVQQAERYGVELLQAVSVTTIEAADAGHLTVGMKAGARYEADAVLIASGSSYRRTDAPGEAELIGAGVHFCATCDGPFYRGAKELAVIGSGNSGLEEGLFLTQFVDMVTVIERSPTLRANRLVQDKVVGHPKMRVLTNTLVTGFRAEDGGKLDSIDVADPDGSNPRELHPAAAFVFIGLDPNTSFLRGAVDLDERGFVLTDGSLAASMPGVFAAGDVRAGSTKQLASAVGEGAAAAIAIRGHLERMEAAEGAHPH